MKQSVMNSTRNTMAKRKWKKQYKELRKYTKYFIINNVKIKNQYNNYITEAIKTLN